VTKPGLAVLLLALACRGEPGAPTPLPVAPSASSPSRSLGSGSIGPPRPPPTPRQGMVFVPDGALVAGTPPSRLPRMAEAEMPGEQVVLHGFYIDIFPFPNEEGAIPLSNVNRDQAQVACAERGKRLCSELEWERACKGPENRVYEYGDQYRSEHCGTGIEPGLRPTGLRVGCRSDFGVRDLHGGVFEWTSSPWGRGSSGNLFTVRGGNGTAGEVIGRCANGRGLDAATKSGSVGFRCCAGEPNTAEVSLLVPKVRHLEAIGRLEPKLEARLRAVIPDEVTLVLGKTRKPRFDQAWIWRPVPNDALYVASLCTGLSARLRCGVLLARDELERSSYVTFASSGRAVPTLEMEYDPRDLYLYGADNEGRYRRPIAYAWGRVDLQPEDRRIGKPKPKKKKKQKTAKR
jgi:formylglycine-generating enzyme